MKIANILSDLTSLRVCDHNAALALVSTRASPPKPSAPQSAKPGQDSNMQRALDLLELHNGVKLNHVRGEDHGLTQARRDVDNVLAQLDERTSRQGSSA
ncbi:MAG: hypothetical protein Q9228_000507 [Teloschistes exilis]